MKKYLAIIGSVLALALGGAWYANMAFGAASFAMNPTYGVQSNGSTTAEVFITQTKATTTAVWITPGVGTTTVTLPTPASLGLVTKYDKARLFLEITATNTPQNPSLDVRLEHSLNGIDWFSDGVGLVGTTTLATPGVIRVFVSTSTLYNAYGNINRVFQSFDVETPSQYNRVVIYSPIGGQNFTVWAALQPIKEVQVINQ